MITVVCSVVARRNKKFLFVRELKAEAAGKYGLPGGRLEHGETLLECAIREFREETGYEARGLELVAITHKPLTQHGNAVVRFVYQTTTTNKEAIPAELESVWLSKKEVAALAIHDQIRGADVLDLLKEESKALTILTY